jgi:phage tail sheath gpL-like
VTLTAKNAGTLGNSIDIRVGWFFAFDDQPLSGITAVVAAGTAGTTDPSIGTVITAIANDWYTDIAMPWTDATNMAALETELARRYAALGGLDAHAFTAITGSYATATTWSSARNSAFVSTLPIGTAPLDPPWVWAATLAGVAADQARADPARQLGSLSLPGIKAPVPAAQFLDSEQNLMLGKGLSSWDTDPSGNVTLNRVVTNYTKAVTGAADTAWLDISVPRTSSRIRYDWLTYSALNFPRHKLADDGGPQLNTVASAAPIVTPRSMLGSWIARCRLYAQLGWIEDLEYTKANSFFERDAGDRNRLNGRQSVKIIGNLMVLAGALEFQA